MERAQLSAARHRKHWSLEEAAERLRVDKATLQRWEKGKSMPQAPNLRKLCEVYEMTARELGLEESYPIMTRSLMDTSETDDDALTSFRKQDFTLRLMRIAWNWSCHNARYHELQMFIILELEDNSSMNPHEAMSRRDALRRLALLPIEMCGLSAMIVVIERPIEEILAQCAAGITACWYLRKGKELAFVSDAVSRYLPTLKEIARSASTLQRKAAADLLVQCLLLKSILARHIADSNNASLRYAQQAEIYGEAADNRALQILAVRTQANAYDYADNWEQALQAGEKAKYFLETNRGTPIPSLIASYVYAGLANYQGHNGRKQDAQRSLGQAYTTFFAQSSHEATPPWIDHNQANLLLHDGLAHFYLGLSKEAHDSFAQISNFQTTSETTRVEALLDQVLVELQREDIARDMDYCIDHWTRGAQGAITMQSEQRFDEALAAYTAMRAA